MTHQLGRGQIPNITEVKIEVAEIKKIVDDLYDIPFIPTPVTIMIEQEREVENIQSNLEEGNTEREREKRKHRGAEKETLKKVKKYSIQSEQDRQVRVQEMLDGAGSIKMENNNTEGVVIQPLYLTYH